MSINAHRQTVALQKRHSVFEHIPVRPGRRAPGISVFSVIFLIQLTQF
jgi:hypothetical protein